MSEYILNFGTAVDCYDKQCGKLIKVAFNSEERQVSNLIVEDGLLVKQSRAFPFSVVERAGENGVRIAVGENDLNDYPEYSENIIEKVPDEGAHEPALIQGSPYGLATSSPAVPIVRELVIEGVADNLDIIDKETPLEAVDGPVGKVRGLAVVPETGLLTHVLIQQGRIFTEEFWLSTAVVERISSKGIFVSMTKDELDELIQLDEEQERYQNRMPTDKDLESDDTDADPVLEQKENVTHDKTLVEETSLSAVISKALLDDSRTENAVIEVIHERGMVTLQGTVEDPETKEAAESIAGAYPGVVSVTNELVVDHQ